MYIHRLFGKNKLAFTVSGNPPGVCLGKKSDFLVKEIYVKPWGEPVPGHMVLPRFHRMSGAGTVEKKLEGSSKKMEEKLKNLKWRGRLWHKS